MKENIIQAIKEAEEKVWTDYKEDIYYDEGYINALTYISSKDWQE